MFIKAKTSVHKIRDSRNRGKKKKKKGARRFSKPLKSSSSFFFSVHHHFSWPHQFTLIINLNQILLQHSYFFFSISFSHFLFVILNLLRSFCLFVFMLWFILFTFRDFDSCIIWLIIITIDIWNFKFKNYKKKKNLFVILVLGYRSDMLETVENIHIPCGFVVVYYDNRLMKIVVVLYHCLINFSKRFSVIISYLLTKMTIDDWWRLLFWIIIWLIL